MSPQRVVVKVPATTANLGPGFDCLGLALDIHNTVSLEVGDSPEVAITGQGADTLPKNPTNAVYRAAEALYRHLGRPTPPLRLSCHNEIPLARGLGSSAAAAVGGLVAANVLCGSPLSEGHLVLIAARLEGHPDNVAPATKGGCCVALEDGGRIVTASIPFPTALKTVLFIPDFKMPTAESRLILPQTISREDAVFNVARTALLVASLATGQTKNLQLATQDRLHQPARQTIFPAMADIFAAALEAGALGAFLSGAGPTVLALATENEEDIAHAMLGAAEKRGVSGRTCVTRPSPQGARIIAYE